MRKATLLKYLASHTIFSDLKPDHLQLLAQHAKDESVDAGHLLFRQGESAEQFYIVREGEIQVEVPSINGPALVVQSLGPDEVLGWSWLIPPYRWTFEAKAKADTTLYRFDGRALLALCDEDPAFGYALLKRFAGLMSQRLQAARTRMMDSWAPPGWA